MRKEEMNLGLAGKLTADPIKQVYETKRGVRENTKRQASSIWAQEDTKVKGRRAEEQD